VQSNCIFALDIGTRSVVGIIASRATESETLEIIDVEMLEHQERSMIGGQIHDIPKVAGTVSRIKRTFEEKHNTELKEVAVAAAGRSLLLSEAAGLPGGCAAPEPDVYQLRLQL